MDEYFEAIRKLQEQHTAEIVEAEARCARRLSHAAALGFLPYWTESRIWSMLERECEAISERIAKEVEALDDRYYS